MNEFLLEYKRFMTSDKLKWQDEAVCASVDTEPWFPDFERQGKVAKSICENCPVKVDCYNYAVENGEINGIWGGVDFTIRTSTATEADRYRVRGETLPTHIETSEYLRLTKQSPEWGKGRIRLR